MTTCGLHCILAHRRYLWKFLFHVFDKHGQENVIRDALRERYWLHIPDLSVWKLFKKQAQAIWWQWHSLNWTWRNLFSNFWKKISEVKSFEKMRQVENLYDLFSDLAKDIRSVAYDKERANTFSQRANSFFLGLWKFFPWYAISTYSKGPYFRTYDDVGRSNALVIWLFLLHSSGTS